ncbi:unnamed protein product [Rotaria sp. Silwood2]|nr:unnamed protein product [Rotaria sp. Silwood2]CAF3361022.1 unnamed protein product [Rotaria sp. Silwood2]CAF4528253.1 unnamed protein product [Rotaria sp. Silwood2]CAF4697272.1 unnamed protein product [Rotaria sp. Silwood2]
MSVLSIACLCFLILSFDCINSQSHQYDSTCNCASISSNGNVCLQYTCVTERREPKCFPGRSIVVTENGLMKSLSNIEIGDRVLVMNKENKLIYEPIEGFIHLKRNGLFSFLLINIEIDDHRNITTCLFISPNHLIFLANDTELKSAIFASQLRLGDHVKYVYKNEIISAKIQNIYLTIEEGYYAPLTPSGTIIIDNALVSNYASVNNHYLAHSVMKIYRRWVYLFGSNKNNENIHWLLRLIERLVQWYGIEKFGQTSMFNGVFQVAGFI